MVRHGRNPSIHSRTSIAAVERRAPVHRDGPWGAINTRRPRAHSGAASARRETDVLQPLGQASRAPFTRCAATSARTRSIASLNERPRPEKVRIVSRLSPHAISISKWRSVPRPRRVHHESLSKLIVTDAFSAFTDRTNSISASSTDLLHISTPFRHCRPPPTAHQ